MPMVIQKDFYTEIMSVAIGFFSAFRNIQESLEQYLRDDQAPATAYYNLQHLKKQCDSWLDKNKNLTKDETLKLQKKGMVERLRVLVDASLPDGKTMAINHFRSLRIIDGDIDPNKFSKSILGAYTFNVLTQIYQDTIAKTQLSTKELDVYKDLVASGDLTLPVGMAELYRKRLAHLLATGYNARGEGSTAMVAVGGGFEFTIGLDLGKLILPLGFELSASLSLKGARTTRKIVAVERQNELSGEQKGHRTYCLMDLLGWSGELALGAQVKASVGHKLTAGDFAAGMESASFQLGAELSATASAEISGTYLTVCDDLPHYFDSPMDMEQILFDKVNSMPKRHPQWDGKGTFFRMWSHAYSGSLSAEAFAGAKGSTTTQAASETVSMEVLPNHLSGSGFASAEANATLSAMQKSSYYRFQTLTSDISPGDRYVQTQDTRATFRQVGASAEVRAGVGAKLGTSSKNLLAKSSDYELVNTAVFESAIGVWNQRTSALMPGTGFVKSISVSMRNLMNTLTSGNPAFIQTLADTLGVTLDQLQKEVFADQMFRTLLSDLNNHPDLNLSAVFLEASYAYNQGGNIPLDSETGQVTATFFDRLRKECFRPGQLQSIRLSYRRADTADNSYTVFKLGFNHVVKLGLSLGKIEQAGTAEMINLYTRWFNDKKKWNDPDPNYLDNTAVIFPKLFM